jgi:hypothetical protein
MSLLWVFRHVLRMKLTRRQHVHVHAACWGSKQQTARILQRLLRNWMTLICHVCALQTITASREAVAWSTSSQVLAAAAGRCRAVPTSNPTLGQ